MSIFRTILLSFGYKDFNDFITTLQVKSMMKGMVFLSIGLGTVTALFEKFLGLEPMAYFVILLLFILEFLTGVTASIFVRLEKFNSLKMGRMVLKVFIYSLVLGIFNVLSNSVGGFEVLSGTFHFNFFEWVYFIVLNLLILQLLISVFENLEELGFKEVTPLLRIFKKRKRDIEQKIEEFNNREKENSNEKK